MGLISHGNETIYRSEVRLLVDWCTNNNLELNIKKTKEMIIDFRKIKNTVCSLEINHQQVEQVKFFTFLGSTITNTLKWDIHISIVVKKAQQRLYFLRQLKKFGVGQRVLIHFYRAIIESVLTFSITVWYGNASQRDRESLDRIVRIAVKIIGCELPSI